MAIQTAKVAGVYPVRSGRLSSYFLSFEFEGNGTSAPDGLSPALPGITLGRTGAGAYTVTFAENIKPQVVHTCIPTLVEDLPGWHVKFVSYTLATGVMLFQVTDEDNTSGIELDADITDKTVNVFMFASDSDKS